MSSSRLAAVRIAPAGTAAAPILLGPYQLGDTQFVSDIVIRDGEAYAVWIDLGGAPGELYAARVCGAG